MLEASHSGRVHGLGKLAGCQNPQGFESLRFRQEIVTKYVNKENGISTQKAYNTYADQYSKKFDAFGSRSQELKRVLELASKPFHVLELGCGNGRDAKFLCEHVAKYVGIDTAPKLITIAKQNAPQGTFFVKDFTTAKFHSLGKFNIIISLDALIHCSDSQLATVFKEIYSALTTDGIAYLSFKYGRYHEEHKHDALGLRYWYCYNPTKVQQLLPKGLRMIKHDWVADKSGTLQRKRFVAILKKHDS